MKSHTHKRIWALILLLTLLLTGCAEAQPGLNQDAVPPPADSTDPVPEVPEDTVKEEAPDRSFSLFWNPDRQLNPIYGRDMSNCDIFGLVYEGLFRLGEGFEPEGVLCSDYHTDDGVIYTFTMRRGVYFHTGQALTAQDAAYSINLAAGSDKYKSRLSNLIAVNAKGDYTLEIVQRKADYTLPMLLDIPIIQNHTGDQTTPPGTGRYRMVYEDKALVLFGKYRRTEGTPPELIRLVASAEKDMSRAFSTGAVSALNCDLTGIESLNLHRSYEARYYDTTNLIYIGYNLEVGHLTASNEVRHAVSLAIDTRRLCTQVYGRSALYSPLVLSPALECYSESWEPEVTFDRKKSAAALNELGLSDWDNDGVLEYSPLGGNFTMTVLVYSGNAARVEAAEMVVQNLRAVGLPAELSALDWTAYKRALKERDFDLCVNEVKLPANFDLTELFTVDGDLNFGCITQEDYPVLISDYLTAPDEISRELAAKALCAHAADHCGIQPVCYKRWAVLTHSGSVQDLSPSQSGAFSDASWSLAG